MSQKSACDHKYQINNRFHYTAKFAAIGLKIGCVHALVGVSTLFIYSTISKMFFKTMNYKTNFYIGISTACLVPLGWVIPCTTVGLILDSVDYIYHDMAFFAMEDDTMGAMLEVDCNTGQQDLILCKV